MKFPRSLPAIAAVLLLAPTPISLATPAAASQAGGAQTAATDILCNGLKIGEFKLTVDPFNNSFATPGGQRRHFGAATTGGFQLTAPAVRDANCWCPSYRWFQCLEITPIGFNPGNGPPFFGQTSIVDPQPTTPVNWGGGVANGDFFPFYWPGANGACGHNSAAARIPIPGAPGKTWDLYYEDAPGLTITEATAPQNFSIKFDFASCLACPEGPIAGSGRNKVGRFQVLACIRWSVTIARTQAGGWTSTIGVPAVVAPAALPPFVAASLLAFNALPGVGNWTIGGAPAPCPPPKLPPLGPEKPTAPGMRFPIVPMEFDPFTGLLEIPAMLPTLLDDSGIDGPTPPQFLGDPMFDGLLGSLSFRYAGLMGPGQFLFVNDTQTMNLHLDDPFDLPDQTLFPDPDVQGNPNGWETFISGGAPAIVYDAGLGAFVMPVLDPWVDPLVSPFAAALADSIEPQRDALALFFLPLVDPIAATQQFTVPAQMQVDPFILPMEVPIVGQPYCAVELNSIGLQTQLHATGSPFVQDNQLLLHSTQMPPGAFGFVIVGDGQIFVPNPGGSQGNLCVGPNIGRGVGDVLFDSGPFGSATVTANLLALPTPGGPVPVLPGESWAFQTWHRDAGMMGPTSNLSNGLLVQFQ